MVVRRVAVLALLVALAGCQEESADPPSPKPSPTVTESPTESPSAPAEPDMPAAAKEPTQAGAEAFVRYYWDLVNYAQATGDTKRLKQIAAETCTPCQGGTNNLDEIHRLGGRISGGDYAVSEVRATRLGRTVPSFRILATVENSKQVIDFPGDRPDGGFGASTNPMIFAVDYLNDAWTMSHLGKDKP